MVQELHCPRAGRGHTHSHVGVAAAEQRRSSPFHQASSEEAAPLVQINVHETKRMPLSVVHGSVGSSIEDFVDLHVLVPTAQDSAAKISPLHLPEVDIVGAADKLQNPRQRLLGWPKLRKPPRVGLASDHCADEVLVCVRDVRRGSRASGGGERRHAMGSAEFLHLPKHRHERGFGVTPNLVEELMRRRTVADDERFELVRCPRAKSEPLRKLSACAKQFQRIVVHSLAKTGVIGLVDPPPSLRVLAVWQHPI
mmetsp:Transcript_8458/g.21749  ORF Transcript_8458/g.21749 Transcript_8458/m.21749 type:complete len:253 (+) Transcript_8458:967-1725(+)